VEKVGEKTSTFLGYVGLGTVAYFGYKRYFP
jgi:hypothetical protein